jgi:hypothetical protein
MAKSSNNLGLENVFLDFDRSYTQIDIYKNCPRLYYYRYGKKIWAPKGKNLLFGDLVHTKIAEKLYTGEYEITKKDITWPDVFQNVRFKVEKLIEGGMKKLKELGVNPKLIKKEHIEFKLKGPKFKGKIDFMGFLENYDPIIIDWKTTSWDYEVHQILSSWQLMSYAWLIWKNKGFIPLTAYITLDKKTDQTRHYITQHNENDMFEFEHLLEWADDGIKRKQFPKNEKNCFAFGQQCEFYEKCWGNKTVDKTKEVLPTL